jgi:hypothetical protein
MKRTLCIVCVVILAFASVCLGGSRGSIKRLQEFQRQIGSDLIGIKKQHPNTQMQVYTVLDQLSKYYSFSKNIVSKKKRYKKLLKNELAQTELLKKNIGEIKNKLYKMKRAMVVASEKLRSNHADSEKLKQERDALIREKEKWEVEQNALVQERNMIAQERDALVQDKEQKENSTSAPISPR